MPLLTTQSAKGYGVTLGSTTPVGAFESIATYTGTQTSAVTFSSIPGTFDHLQLRITSRGTTSGVNIYANVRANGDTGSNYTYHYFEDSGVDSIGSGASTSQAQMYSSYTPASSASTNFYNHMLVDVLDYASINKYKSFRYESVAYDGSDGRAAVMAGAWMNKTSAITSITITCASGDWTANSHFALYGIKGS